MSFLGVIKKYRQSSDVAKASVWYTICNTLQKLAVFLIIPILVRLLTTTEYGMYVVFLSWIELMEIFATMRIYSNGYVAGLIKNSDDQDRYTCSMQVTILLFVVICFLLCWYFIDSICDFIKLPTTFFYYMFLSFLATGNIGLWSARQRVNNKYKSMVVVTLLYSILPPVFAITTACLSDDRLGTVIAVSIITQFLISFPFCLTNLIGTKNEVVFKYCKEALRYNLPLVPYYLSMVVLNSTDRIMISQIVGEAEAGIYSIAYSLSMAMYVFAGALNYSLQPWMFNKIKQHDMSDSCRVITTSVAIIAILSICVLIISPELITLMASDRYRHAMWTMPPVVCSLLVMFIYQQMLNIHFYFDKTKIVFVASVFAAILNIFLNYFCIKEFGYLAAGYTTFFSYFVVGILYYVTMLKISNSNKLDYRCFFDMKVITVILIGLCFLAALIALVFPFICVRYLVVAGMISVVWLKRECVMKFLAEAKLLNRNVE